LDLRVKKQQESEEKCMKIIFTICTHPRMLLSICLYSPCKPWPLIQFPNLYTVSRTPWTSDQPVARPLPTQRTTKTRNKRKQTSMPLVGFEPTIPAFERAKTVHALDCAVTGIGRQMLLRWSNQRG
jgi:hypothetical protein